MRLLLFSIGPSRIASRKCCKWEGAGKKKNGNQTAPTAHLRSLHESKAALWEQSCLSEENGALELAARQSSYKRIFAGRKFSLSGSSLLAVLSGQFSLADSPPEQATFPGS